MYPEEEHPHFQVFGDGGPGQCPGNGRQVVSARPGCTVSRLPGPQDSGLASGEPSSVLVLPHQLGDLGCLTLLSPE